MLYHGWECRGWIKWYCRRSSTHDYYMCCAIPWLLTSWLRITDGVVDVCWHRRKMSTCSLPTLAAFCVARRIAALISRGSVASSFLYLFTCISLNVYTCSYTFKMTYMYVPISPGFLFIRSKHRCWSCRDFPEHAASNASCIRSSCETRLGCNRERLAIIYYQVSNSINNDGCYFTFDISLSSCAIRT